MSPAAGDLEYAKLAMKLNQNGLPGVATIKSVTESGEGDTGKVSPKRHCFPHAQALRAPEGPASAPRPPSSDLA